MQPNTEKASFYGVMQYLATNKFGIVSKLDWTEVVYLASL